MSERLALMIDLERCIGCKSCEVACKTEHGLGPSEYRNRVVWLGDPSAAALDFMTVACQHCERPACLRACPVNPKAITKDPVTGVVRVNEDRCTGCGECVVACPYGAMGYDQQDHHAVKCDLCTDRRAEAAADGEAATTACASACPGHAISFGLRDDLLARAATEGRAVRDNDPFLMGPGTVYLDRLPNPEREARVAAANAVAVRANTPPAPPQTPALIDDGSRDGRMDLERAGYPYRMTREERRPDRVEPGGCNICFNCCTTKFHFKGDQLVKVTGNEEDPLLKGRVCPKSQLTLQLYNSTDRLTHPLKRVGARGENKFEPISWDQALDEIADKLKALRAEHGAETLGIFSGTRTGIITNRGYIRLFAQLWGTPNVESTEPFCSAGKNVAYQIVQGTGGCPNSYTETDIGSAELYVYIGDNQAETRPTYFGQVNDWRIRNGARLVVIDPRHTVTASKADRWLPIRPGTDMALGLALCQHILANGLQDQRYCENWVEGWEAWRDFILEKGYTPDWAAALTGLAAADIRQLAEEIAAADGCMIFGSRGINQHSNSTQTNRVLMFLAAITGNWGRKGGGFNNMSVPVPIVAEAPRERRAPIARPKVRHSPAGWTTAMRERAPYPLTALIASNNPLALWPDQTKAREALQALELLVHIDLFPNETSAFADYVLPAAMGIEKDDIGRANEDRRIVWTGKMMDPPGEAKPDGWIWVELGKRMGFDDVLKDEYKDVPTFWDEVLIQNPAARGITQKRLHSVPWRWVRFPVASEDAPEIETLFLEGVATPGVPEGKRFPTDSGKLEFWTEAQEAKFAQIGLSALPEFYGEREALIDMAHVERLGDDDSMDVMAPFMPEKTAAVRARIKPAAENEIGRSLRDQGFDTELVTGRPAAPQFHGWMHYSWQAQEMYPDLYVQMHPERAEALGIDDGDRVRVESAHGMVEARAWITAGIRREAVFLPIGWGEQQPFHPWRPVNYLTHIEQRDPLSDQSNLKSLLCRVTAA